MATSGLEFEVPLATDLRVSTDSLEVELLDGRTLSVPLIWFPRLLHASPAERRNWRLIGRGGGIHWPEIDEDISIEGLLAGRTSGESQSSLRKWLDSRA